ncbi:MAG: hypothetical protein Q9188_002424 [Gyalolechia gomerana]
MKSSAGDITIYHIVLAAVGCVSNSPGVSNIFNSSYRDSSLKPSKGSVTSAFELPTGYFARSSTLSVPHVKALLKIALDNQAKTISWVLLAAGISFVFGLLFVFLPQFNLKRVQRKPTAARKIMILKRLMLCFLWTSTALAFSASLTTTQLARTIQRPSTSSTSIVANLFIIEGGMGLQVLQWLAASLSTFFATGVSSIFVGAGGDGQSATKDAFGSDDVPEY